MSKLKFILLFVISLLFQISIIKAEIINEVIIKGNKRIPNETILMFADVETGKNLNNNELNLIIENLYGTNFFKNISTKFENNILTIVVDENPIIESIKYNGIKSSTLKDFITDNLILKERSSYNEFQIEKDKLNLVNALKRKGYYFASVEVLILDKGENLIDLIYEIETGKKAKIKKISFTGDKVFKDSRLKSIIISEEYKFWKFISGKKYLNEELILFDNKLLKNFYLNKGYYNVKINSSFAKLIDNENFELIFNIDANNKVYFNELNLKLPNDFNEQNFTNINDLFKNLRGKPYSIKRIEKILKKINDLTINEQFVSTKASVKETLIENRINLEFIISETEKIFISKINIFGNNITKETVIRNQFEVDEGDPFNEILFTRSINNIKSLNFFKDVKYEILDDDTNKIKTINITVEEKPTGEIMAGAGFGTSGTTTAFGVKENNYLGSGIALDAEAEISSETLKGKFSLINPNYKNSDKSLYTRIEATETDRLKNFGYKTNRTGFGFGTSFEYYDNLNLGIGFNSYIEKIDTDSTASTRRQKQKGNYFDNFVNLTFDYDKRNQKFQTTNGFRNYYSLTLPVISETNTLENTFISSNYIEYLDNTVLKSSIYFQSANSITGEDIKLSERTFLPSSRLRGFERGKVGPKDGDDFIGGNFAASLNVSSNIPNFFEDSQTTDFNLFFDMANVWGVDYDSSLDSSNSIRSSIGIGLDWFSPVGPMNFTLSQPITKSSTDITESFRFNLGTTF